MKNNPKEAYIRPDNLLKSMGIEYNGLTEAERAMKKLLMEEYKKKGLNVGNEVKKWREANPESSFGDAIRALYQELENK